MLKVTVHKIAEDVQTKLEKMDLTIEDLQEAARANFLAQASCTPNDAPTAAGVSGWIASVRHLREFLTVKGWKKENIKNSPRLIHPNGEFSIMFATGDDSTGNPIFDPKTKSNKGRTTRDSVNDNFRQASLFDLEMIPHVVPLNKFKQEILKMKPTWVFLIHVQIDQNIDDPKHILRCELSLPTFMDDAGYISGWSERIIIPEIDISIDPMDKKTEFAPDQEIVLKRKK